MKRPWKVIALAGGLALLGGGAWHWTHRTHKEQLNKFESIVVTRGDLEESVEASGEVAPLNRVEIKPPIQGRIEKLLVEEGTAVREGQILAWMSSSDRAAILDAARAKGPAEVRRWEDAYKATPIVAPLSGVIILKAVVVGETVSPNSVLYAMSDRLIVLAHVDEADIARISVGMPARVTLDAYPDHTVDGKVFQILFEGRNVSNVITYGVKIDLKEVPPFFRSQMTANIHFILASRSQVLWVPSRAVQTSSDKTREVWVPDPQGKPLVRKVQTGLEANGQVEILSGLQEGDRVLVQKTAYVPQRAPQSSPLVFTGPGRSTGTVRNAASSTRRRTNASAEGPPPPP